MLVIFNRKVEGNESGKKETTYRYKCKQLDGAFYLIARKKRALHPV
jgi:hypothetical protein